MPQCFQCLSEIETVEKACPVCHWSEPGHITDDDSRFLIFLTLVQRAIENHTSSINKWVSLRLEPTAREFAVFEHGEQCRLDGVCWRITAKNREKTILFVRGWKAGLTENQDLVTVDCDEDLEQAIKKREKEQRLWAKQRAEGERRLAEARKKKIYGPEHVEWMTPEDWDSLSEEEAEDLHRRYEESFEAPDLKT